MRSPSADTVAAPPVSGWADTEVSVRLRRGAGGTVRVEGELCRAPIWFRWDGATLWLVGSGASPVGEDHLRVRVDVGPGVAVAVRSVAATVVYAARGAGTRWDTDIHVAEGARLDWRPEPVILTERARHASTTTVHAAGGADVTIDDVLVLGRTRDGLGHLCATIAVDVDGSPVLRTSIDTSLPGWAGPGGVAGTTVVASRLRLRGAGAAALPAADVVVARSSVALLRPANGCRLAVATDVNVNDARRSLDTVLPD